MALTFKIPLYAKASLSIVGLFAFVGALYIAQSIIVPLIYAIIFGILLQRPISWLIKKKVNRVVAIIVVLTIGTLLIAASGILLFSQASHFGESLPALINKLQELLNQAGN